VASVLIALSPSLAQAQTADDLSALRKDIDTLKEGQAALRVQQIKNRSVRPRPRQAGPAPEVA
jgi:hypothetical protein